MEVKFQVRVIKSVTTRWPRGETPDCIFTVGNARPLDQALQHATTEMLRWLTDGYGMTLQEASQLLGQAVEYDVANVYNPAYSMVCKLSKRLLPDAGTMVNSINGRDWPRLYGDRPSRFLTFPALLFPVFHRRYSKRLFEHFAEIFLVLVTGHPGDLHDLQIRMQKQRLRLFHPMA